MKTQQIFWHLYVGFLVVITLLAIVAGIVSVSIIKDSTLNRTEKELQIFAITTASLIADIASQQQGPLEQIDLQPIVTQAAGDQYIRLTLIDKMGNVLADSKNAPEKMDNHRNRPEVKTALAGTQGQSTRFSTTVGQDMLYVAVPINLGPDNQGAFRVATPLLLVQERQGNLYRRFLYGLILITVGAAIAAFLVARQISRPLERLRRGAELISKGDLSHHFSTSGPAEIRILAETMNDMTDELNHRLAQIEEKNRELKQVFANMVECVFVISEDSTVLDINQSAAELCQTTVEEGIGKKLQELIRNNELSMIARDIFQQGNLTGEVYMEKPAPTFLRVAASSFRKNGDKTTVALIVLHDITDIKQIENMRRDFVANVSHELRTPITSIKGFSETLLDGALDTPEDATRFVEIINKKSNQLEQLISDILLLSRIENNLEAEREHLSEGHLSSVVDSVEEALQLVLKRKNIKLITQCPEDLTATFHPTLLEQALSNLISNSVRYSNEGSEIHLTVQHTDKEITLKVKDFGCGIEPQHLARLFEHFYRVDKARSRDAGGTGLGLSIVKHISRLHHGTVTVESEPGQGSTFTIHLPLKLEVSGKDEG